MNKNRLAALLAVLAIGTLSGGCAVYSTPSGDVIAPAPVVVAPVVVAPPAVVVSPFGYFGGHRHYHRPYSHAPRYRGPYGTPRYYGRPYYRY